MSTGTSFANTVGALEVGTSFSLFLFGIVTMQTYMYYSNFGDDRLAFKFLVAVVWVLELGHTIAVSRELYNATRSSAPEYPIFGVVTMLSGFITTLVQLFFSYRVWTALPSPWRVIAIVTTLIALSRCGMSTYIGIEATVWDMNVEQSRRRYERFITVLLVTAAAIDMLIAASMLWFFSSKRDPLLKMIKLIDHLMLITIRTGLITSIAAVAVLILYQTMQETFIFLAVFTCLAKLYSNSLLSSLNARNSLRDTAAKEHAEESPRPSTSRRGILNSISKDRESKAQIPPTSPIFIKMRTTTEMRRDDSFC